jgi:hypothetical protein
MRQILTAWVFSVAFQASYLNAVAATTVRTVALSGQQAPGTLDGEAFQFFMLSPAINNAGQTAFRASVVTRVGAWSEGSGALSLVARVGDPVSSLPTGIVYSSVGYPLIGEDGSTVLLGGITGPGTDSTNDSGILSNRTGSLQCYLRHHSWGLASTLRTIRVCGSEINTNSFNCWHEKANRLPDCRQDLCLPVSIRQAVLFHQPIERLTVLARRLSLRTSATPPAVPKALVFGHKTPQAI